MLLIREETPKDHEEVRRVIRRAFENAEHTDHDEHNLVDRLRKSDAFIPELSLVAEMDGKIIGHVLFSKIRIQDTVQVALAPVSVLPDLQGRGVGSALIRKGMREPRKWVMISRWSSDMPRIIPDSAMSRRRRSAYALPFPCPMKTTWRSGFGETLSRLRER